MKIIKESISQAQLIAQSEVRFADMVKAVVDIDRRVMAIGGELHADEEKLLLENGSKQEDLWGINLYTDEEDEDWIEFDSMINLRPNQNNNSRGVDDEEIKTKIIEIVNSLVVR